jgi:hypothetical protein
MIILGLTAAMVVQTDRNIATGRRQTSESLSVAEGAVDRLLLHLSRRDNSILLGRDYDPINPATGETYLGTDGEPNSGDETTTPLDLWTGYDPSSEPCFQQASFHAPTPLFTSALGGEGRYRLLAYRYHPQHQTGTFLVEGRFRNQSTATVLVTVRIQPQMNAFPGVIAMNPNVGHPSDPYWVGYGSCRASPARAFRS